MKAGEFTPDVKARIQYREDGCCGSCGRPVEAVGAWVHQHRRARGMGGSKAADTGSVVNGVLQCGTATTFCNGYTETHPTWALAMGYRVPQGADPALIPIWIARAGWVLLEPDGTYQPVEDPHPAETHVLETVSAWLLEHTS